MVRTWVSSRWKNPGCPGQFSVEINMMSIGLDILERLDKPILISPPRPAAISGKDATFSDPPHLNRQARVSLHVSRANGPRHSKPWRGLFGDVPMRLLAAISISALLTAPSLALADMSTTPPSPYAVKEPGNGPDIRRMRHHRGHYYYRHREMMHKAPMASPAAPPANPPAAAPPAPAAPAANPPPAATPPATAPTPSPPAATPPTPAPLPSPPAAPPPSDAPASPPAANTPPATPSPPPAPTTPPADPPK
jgi:hypothetical protein